MESVLDYVGRAPGGCLQAWGLRSACTPLSDGVVRVVGRLVANVCVFFWAWRACELRATCSSHASHCEVSPEAALESSGCG